MAAHQPETLNYVFKLGRRKLHIEVPHLGPEETRTAKPIDNTNVTQMLCAPGPTKTSTLDF